MEQLRQARLKHKIMLDHDDTEEDTEDQKYGTIGAIARDPEGNLAAATSTGGIVNKRMGRVGDSPIIGAGVYADNETCAVSATGFGEDFMRSVISKTISDFMYMKAMDATQATAAGIEYLVRKVHGRGGVIVIDIIQSGNAHAVIAGGMENMSSSPYLLTVDYEMRIIIIKPVLGNEEEFTRTLNDLLTEVD